MVSGRWERREQGWRGRERIEERDAEIALSISSGEP